MSKHLKPAAEVVRKEPPEFTKYFLDKLKKERRAKHVAALLALRKAKQGN